MSAMGIIILRVTPSNRADTIIDRPAAIKSNLCGHMNLNSRIYCFIANYVIIYIDFCRAICYYRIMPKIKVAVIGTGYLGSIHARLFKQNKKCTLEAVCDINQARLEEVSRSLKVPGYPDFRQLFGLADCVSIAVPTKYHFSIAKACLEHGMDVLVEKPFTERLTQADILIGLAKKTTASSRWATLKGLIPLLVPARNFFVSRIS